MYIFVAACIFLCPVSSLVLENLVHQALLFNIGPVIYTTYIHFSLHFRITEALVKADGHLQISEAINDMEEYIKLTGQWEACV